ncbi:potassium transporter KtrB [Deinococcus psychrotolerans]|uniref:Potassium transporter KtrB n=1 Tax=Deinococcus psychrotolerans TaxID=2489213 RepID=A0A3G8YER5_9DEIO|nr:TrkH family potassium uptake protein [Deinococcus psychrotolerans]AZI43465.1 potassium transporter KtrB [Deinococcus psychrotolerans]
MRRSPFSPSSRLRLNFFSFSKFTPPQLIALTFAVTIVVGALLLYSPLAHQSGHSLSLVQSFFMATSALCVTGLAVVDVGSTFNLFGQLVMLTLIQIGGLGIITFGTLFAFLLGRRINFSERVRLAQQVSAFDTGGVVRLIRQIFIFTLSAEALGTLLLALRFVPKEGWGKGLYFSLFHAVSAYNNAGFSLYPDNLMGFAGDPLINLVIGGLIILGGMGFIVQINILGHWRSPRRERILVHSKIVLSVMAALLAVGMLSFLLFDWNNPRTLGPLPFGEKLLVSFFQGVTPRTAGFNTVDYSLISQPSLFITIILMFIGANPGSTGGGIKTSTFFVMMMAAISLVRGRSDLAVFGRRVDRATIVRAMTVGLLSMGLVNTGFLLLLIANKDNNLSFERLFFETVSAFGTAGLSMNATTLLNANQEIIVSVLMYLGRIGPLTFAVAFGNRVKSEPVKYPPERDILIG